MKMIKKNKLDVKTNLQRQLQKKLWISLESIQIEIPEMIQSFYKLL